MTMPHLMNYPHSDEGWCLDCVKDAREISHVRVVELVRELDQLRRERDAAMWHLIGEWRG